MLEYSYKEIKEISKDGILFNDNYKINFNECRKEWAEEKGILIDKSYGIAERTIVANKPYFIFYTKERVKVYFEIRGFFKKIKSRKAFHTLQITINQCGYSSYDMT